MNTVDKKGIPYLVDQLACKLSLKKLVQWWSSTVDQSILFRPLLYILSACDARTPEASRKLGSGLQLIAFLMVVGLFAVIGLPQFANDKSTLALIVVAASGSWFLGRLLGGKERRQVDAIDYLVLLFLAISIVATCASHYLMPSIKGLSKLVVYIVSFFLFTAVFRGSTKRKLIVVATVVATGLALSLYGFYQYKTGVAPLATWEDPTATSTETRIYATLGNPNLLAGYLVPVMPLSVGLGLTLIAQRRFVLGALPLIASAAIALATLLTASRGGYMGLFVGGAQFGVIIITYLWAKSKKARPLIISLALLSILIVGVVLTRIPAFQERVASMFVGREHSSNSYRLNVWGSSWRMFLNNWWIGIGIGNETFRLAYGLYMVSGYDALGTYSVPLEVAVETGVVGLIAFLVLVLATLSRAHNKFWHHEEPYRWLMAGAACAMTAMLTHGLVDTIFYRPQVQLIFWLLIALVIAPDSPKEPDSHPASVKEAKALS